MRLYYFPQSSNSRRALLVARHLGIELDLTEIDLTSEEDRRRLTELNPNSQVPVLEDGSLVLWESGAIMQYLADRTPDQDIYPQNVRDRADVNRWLFWSGAHFAVPVSTFTWEHVWKKRVTGADADPAALAVAAEQMHAVASLLDNHLARREWIVGDRLTLADFAMAGPLTYIEQAHLPLAQYTNLLAWFARIRQLDAWQRTEPVW